jgi:hypothetical protein
MKLEYINKITQSFKINQKGIDDDFILEISDDGKMYEAWLSHTGYGIKEFLFGAEKTQQSYDEFIEYAKVDLISEIADYIERWFEEYERI